MPTRHHAAVWPQVDAKIVDDPAARAAVLARQLSHFEPEGCTRAPPVDVESDRRLMPGIRGMRLAPAA